MRSLSQSLADFIEMLRGGSGEFGIPPHNSPDLLDRWSIAMETQVNVLSALGAPTDMRGVYEDSAGNRFWNIRIPKKANTEAPEFDDYPTPYALPVFAAGIGCTGWDWQSRVSRHFGFDFDSITGHAAGVGIGADELERVKAAACALPWVEVRKSTGGAGLHLYVTVDAVPTATHTEHAALARCILGMMSTEAGFDFASRIDACGGNMWIWHRKMTPANGGLLLVKAPEFSLSESDLPVNWRDHVEVVKRKRSKVTVRGVDDENTFDKLAAAQQCVALDDDHRAILDKLRRMPYACEWVADHNCCRIHTTALGELPQRIKIRGIFQTISEGRDPHTPNGFMFPLPNGAWRVFRFSPGVTEAATWTQDGEGWTTCTFNSPPDLRTAARALGGKFDGERGGYHFDRADQAVEAIGLLGGRVRLPDEMERQDAFVKVGKSGHVSIDIAARDGHCGDMRDWIERKRQKRWLFTTDVVAKEQADPAAPIDGLVRLVKTPSRQDAGWLIKETSTEWSWSSKDNIKDGLIRLGTKKSELNFMLGEAVLSPWKLVNLPFQPDYPGNRQINFGAPQYRFMPAEAESDDGHPHWDMILSHVFQDLNPVLNGNVWARQNNIVTGRDYGLAWIACLLREPFQPLPYLFLFSEEQNTGKSILWEALLLLMTAGVVDAGKALRTNSDFNGELANAVLAYIEELDLGSKANSFAANRVKAWVTSPTISIRKMRTDAYEQANTLHFIQTANDRNFCPVLPGDTRITMLYVPPPEQDIPKVVLKQRLEEEAPQFMRTVLSLQLPSVEGRLRIPVIETESKRNAEEEARDELQVFLDECCEYAHAQHLLFSEFYERFREWLPGSAQSDWSRKKVAIRIPQRFPRRKPDGKNVVINNIRWKAAT